MESAIRRSDEPIGFAASAGPGPGATRPASAAVRRVEMGDPAGGSDPARAAGEEAGRARVSAGGGADRPATIIVFTRYPEPGRAKTRLIPALGPEGAARAHRELAGRTVLVARVASFLSGARLEIHGTGAPPRSFRRWLGDGAAYRAQVDGDLGERIEAALSRSLREDRGPAILVGSDCPGLSPRHLQEAVARLAACDVVIGPALDGGYYLLGLRRPTPELFREIPWGTSAVLQRTRAVVERLGLGLSLLEPLGDIDRPEDLPAWRSATAPARDRSEDPELSIIIPAMNEASSIRGAIESALLCPGVEVIVVDGESSDGTASAAREGGARVLRCPACRALQQDIGALHARGGALLFLHADARLPETYAEEVREILGRPGVIAGAFRLRIDGDGRGVRFVERTALWRARILQMPYGDQAIFLSRATFFEMGGFAGMPILEDWDLVRRLRRRGRIRIGRAAAAVSARRWERLGVWKTTATNKLVILGYKLGVPSERLARLYWDRR